MTQVAENLGVTELIKANLPTLNAKQARWATTRIQNVDAIAEEWRIDQNKVIVFSDPKLKNTPIVMLRKDRLETLQKLVNDLVNGQAFVEHNLKIVMDALIAVKEHIELKSRSLPNSEELDPILKQINVLMKISQSIESRIVIKSSGQKKEIVPPCPEDLVEDDEE